jgi:hypothetical protein
MSRSFVSQANRSFALPVGDTDDNDSSSIMSPDASPAAALASKRSVGFAAMDTDSAPVESSTKVVDDAEMSDAVPSSSSNDAGGASKSAAPANVSSSATASSAPSAAAAAATTAASAGAAEPKRYDSGALKTPPRVSRRPVTTVLPSPLGRPADAPASSPSPPSSDAMEDVQTAPDVVAATATAIRTPSRESAAAAAAAAAMARSAERRQQGPTQVVTLVSTADGNDDDGTATRRQQAQTHVVTLTAVAAAVPSPVAKTPVSAAAPAPFSTSTLTSRTPGGSALRRQQKPTTVVTLMSQDQRVGASALFDVSTPAPITSNAPPGSAARLPPPSLGSASRRQQRPTKIVTLTPAPAHAATATTPARAVATPPKRVVLTPKSASPRTPAGGRSSGMPRQAAQPSSLARGESASAWQAAAASDAAPTSTSRGPPSPIGFEPADDDDDGGGFDGGAADDVPPPPRSRHRNASAIAAVRALAASERDDTADQVIGQLTPSRAKRTTAKPKTTVRKQPTRQSGSMLCPLVLSVMWWSSSPFAA